MNKIITQLLFALLLSPLLLIGQSTNIYFESGIEKISKSNILLRSDVNYSSEEIIDDAIYRYIHFVSIPTLSDREMLNSKGIQLLDYIPNNTFLAKIDVSAIKLLYDFPIIQQVLSRSMNRHMSKNIRNGDIGSWALEGHMVKLMIKYMKHVEIEDVIKTLVSNGATIDLKAPDYNLIHITYPLDQIYELANMASITYYDQISEDGTPEDTEGRALHRSNMINNNNPLGLKYDGEGISVMTRDDGLVGPHIDFQGRLDPTDSYGYLGIQHGDMVSGILAGAGNRDPQKKGMASGATLLIQNYADHFLNGVIDLHKQKNLVITNSSYSNGCNAGYTIITETIDQQLNDFPTLLHVFSAGNSNNRECGYGAGNQWGNITGGHKIAKNCIATANLDINIQVASTSSRGPASDGRLKPDISARGVAQLSTAPNSTYQTGGGTSAASPGIAGISAQLYHVYRDLHNGEYPEAALIKSCMLNTADDLGNPGPDFIHGFGHVNALKAYKLLKEERYVNDSVIHNSSKSIDYNLEVPAEKFKIMLYWRERPGAVMSSKALINDLDLTVEAPDGTKYLPLILDHTPNAINLSMPARQGRDSINNVEQVVIDNAKSGVYKITVRGSSLPDLKKNFIILFEPISDEIIVTYPSGEEHLQPKSTAQVHWDAFGNENLFALQYSIDDGINWKFIANVDGNKRFYNWQVPDVQSAKCLFRVLRDTNEGISQFHFNIMSTPRNLRINKVCPNTIHFVWDSVPGASKYYLYALGEKFMEIVDSSTTLQLEYYVENPLMKHWFALQSVSEEGAVSERSIAIEHDQQLLSCSQEFDIQISQILSPSSLVFDCGLSYNNAIEIELQNNGIEIATDILVGYQLDNGMIIEESFQKEISSKGKGIFKFTNLPDLSSGSHQLKVWCNMNGDSFSSNDTSNYSFKFTPIEEASAAIRYIEEFESNAIPSNWIEDNDLMPSISRWEVINTVLGRDGRRTNAIKMYNYTTQAVYYSDRLRSAPIDLRNAKNPVLLFDWLGASGLLIQDLTYHDTLKVNIYSYCDNSDKVQILKLTKGALITTENRGNRQRDWKPTSTNQWRIIGVSLEDFIGEEIVIEFDLVNGDRAQFYLDNVIVEESSVVFTPPSVNLPEILCVRKKSTIEVINPEPNTNYEWILENERTTSFSGIGPHTIRYFKPGKYMIKLIIIKNNIRKEYKYPIEIFKKPAIRFTNEEISPLEVEFNNTSLFATSYAWDFGDGMMSNEISPTHKYAKNGLYKVELIAENQCTFLIKEIELKVGNVSTNDDDQKPIIHLYPNPVDQTLHVSISDFNADMIDCEIINLSGKRTYQSRLKLIDSNIKIPVDQLPSGVYFITVKSDRTIITKRFIKQ